MNAPEPPYAGVRVIDLSEGIAGGYCTKLLADLGCDVVKVESSSGDPLREWSVSGRVGDDGDPDGVLFRYLHAGKRAVTADADTAAGRAAILDLVEGAAVVVESWPPGTVEARGLGLDELRVRAPAVQLVSISAFGRGGPMDTAVANEFTAQAWSGGMSTRPEAERPPLQAGGATGEYAAGLFAALAALTFLHDTVATGRGDHLDVSMLEALMVTHSSYATVFASYLDRRGVPAPRTIELPSIEPARDGWVGLCTVSGQHFADFCSMVGHPEWAGDPDWSTQPGRQARRHEFRAAVAEWTSTRSIDEIVELCALLRIPAARLGTGPTIPGFDHFVDQGTYVTNPRGGFLQPTVPYRLHRGTAAAPGSAPRRGEHDGTIEPAGPTVRPGVRAWAGTRAGAAEGVGAGDKPLRGLRVADFTAWWAGPFAAHWCALMGADVVHVESPRRPDGMRTASTRPPSHPQWWEWGPVFSAANSAKRGVAVDLTDPEGRALALRLVADCDVVIENFSPRVMEQFGLDYADLAAVRPDLVMVRMPAFGLSGPWRDRTGFAQTMEQISGMAWRTGYPDDQPIIPRGPCDPLAGGHAMVALMGALEQRRRTGEGQLVEVSMVGAALNVAAEVVLEHQAYGYEVQRVGNRSARAAPQGCYRCLDGERGEEWVVVSIEDDRQWSALLAVLGSEAAALADPGLATAEDRRRHHDRIDEVLGGVLAGVDGVELAGRLVSAGVPAAPVWSARRVDELDQPRTRGFLEPVDHPVTGVHELWGMPVVPRTRPGWRWHDRPAPTLGQHNDEVFVDRLGVTPEELGGLRDRGVVGETWAS